MFCAVAALTYSTSDERFSLQEAGEDLVLDPWKVIV